MVCSIDLKYYEILQFNFCCFFICDVWPLQLLINNPVFYYNICGFSAELCFGYNIPIKLIILSFKRIHWKLKLGVAWLRNFEGARIWLSTFRSQLRSKIVLLFESSCYNFLHYLISIDTFYLEMFSRRSTSNSSIDTFYLETLSRYLTSEFFFFFLFWTYFRIAYSLLATRCSPEWGCVTLMLTVSNPQPAS